MTASVNPKNRRTHDTGKSLPRVDISGRNRGIKHIDLGRVIPCPEDVKLLQRITHFDLSHNELEVLTDLHPLTGLRMLDVCYNRITQVLSLPTGLTVLHLSHNRLTSLEGLSDLVHLRELHVDFNRLTHLIGLHPKMPLEIVTAEDNRIEQTIGLDDIPTLKEVSLRNNFISEPSELHFLPSCPSLSSVNLTNNPVTRVKNYRSLVGKLHPQLQTLDEVALGGGADQQKHRLVTGGPTAPSTAAELEADALARRQKSATALTVPGGFPSHTPLSTPLSFFLTQKKLSASPQTQTGSSPLPTGELAIEAAAAAPPPRDDVKGGEENSRKITEKRHNDSTSGLGTVLQKVSTQRVTFEDRRSASRTRINLGVEQPRDTPEDKEESTSGARRSTTSSVRVVRSSSDNSSNNSTRAIPAAAGVPRGSTGNQSVLSSSKIWSVPSAGSTDNVGRSVSPVRQDERRESRRLTGSRRPPPASRTIRGSGVRDGAPWRGPRCGEDANKKEEGKERRVERTERESRGFKGRRKTNDDEDDEDDEEEEEEDARHGSAATKANEEGGNNNGRNNCGGGYAKDFESLLSSGVGRGVGGASSACGLTIPTPSALCSNEARLATHSVTAQLHDALVSKEQLEKENHELRTRLKKSGEAFKENRRVLSEQLAELAQLRLERDSLRENDKASSEMVDRLRRNIKAMEAHHKDEIRILQEQMERMKTFFETQLLDLRRHTPSNNTPTPAHTRTTTGFGIPANELVGETTMQQQKIIHAPANEEVVRVRMGNGTRRGTSASHRASPSTGALKLSSMHSTSASQQAKARVSSSSSSGVKARNPHPSSSPQRDSPRSRDESPSISLMVEETPRRSLPSTHGGRGQRRASRSRSQGIGERPTTAPASSTADVTAGTAAAAEDDPHKSHPPPPPPHRCKTTMIVDEDDGGSIQSGGPVPGAGASSWRSCSEEDLDDFSNGSTTVMHGADDAGMRRMKLGRGTEHGKDNNVPSSCSSIRAEDVSLNCSSIAAVPRHSRREDMEGSRRQTKGGNAAAATVAPTSEAVDGVENYNKGLQTAGALDHPDLRPPSGAPLTSRMTTQSPSNGNKKVSAPGSSSLMFYQGRHSGLDVAERVAGLLSKKQ